MPLLNFSPRPFSRPFESTLPPSRNFPLLARKPNPGNHERKIHRMLSSREGRASARTSINPCTPATHAILSVTVSAFDIDKYSHKQFSNKRKNIQYTRNKNTTFMQRSRYLEIKTEIYIPRY